MALTITGEAVVACQVFVPPTARTAPRPYRVCET